jgi:peptide chain release factor 1
LLAQLNRLERRFLEIGSDMEEAVLLVRRFKILMAQVAETETLFEESSGEMKDLAFEELSTLKAEKTALEDLLHIQLLPKDPNDGKNILLEVRAGAGGDEASLFAAQLFRMYQRYCERRRWRFEVLSLSESEMGGIKEIVAQVEGEKVYRALKFESGVHRVQRVPATESQGRVHTSTVTVAVLVEAEDVDVTINENDLRVDTYRASGAGGQHVNRTDSAVRLTHIPSGIVVACQDERSQIKNKSKAMKVLQAKLLELAQIEKDKALSADRRAQVGRGDRSERIRTYNFPQSRITDHRIQVTSHAINDFMEGHLDEMIDSLQNHYQMEMLKTQNDAQ